MSQRVGGDGGERARGVKAGDRVGEVAAGAVGARILEERAEDRRGSRSAKVSPTTTVQPSGAARVRITSMVCAAVAVDEEGGGLRAGGALAEGHRLGGGGGLVEQRGIGDVERGEVGDHRLIVEERLEPALADLGLVGGVGGVPGGVLEDVALDDRRGNRAVIARLMRLVSTLFFAAVRRSRQRRLLGKRRAPVERLGLADAGGRVSSIRASSEGAPTASSIAAISTGEGPMWRRLAKS